MTHEEIKKALKERGFSFAALAKASNRTHTSLMVVSNRTAKGRPSALIIAAALGKTVTEVFPDIPQYAHASKGNDSVERA